MSELRRDASGVASTSVCEPPRLPTTHLEFAWKSRRIIDVAFECPQESTASARLLAVRVTTDLVAVRSEAL